MTYAVTADAQSHRILLDLPARRLALDYDQYASALADVISNSEPRFAIGIFGRWGSGKTTLMEAILSKLDRRRVVTVWFSAWRYEKEEHLIVPLLDTLREALVEWDASQEAETRAVETASIVGRVIQSLLAGFTIKFGVPHAVEVSLDANKSLAEYAKIARKRQEAERPRSFYHATFRALSKAFAAFVQEDPARRVVIFIDDLDRCLPEGALEVLESMKLFFDLQGFVFVVGLDQRVVELAIEAKYARESAPLAEAERQAYRVGGADYIKKIFQVPFSLRPVAASSLEGFLNAMFEEAKLSSEQEQHLRQTVTPHLGYLIGEGGVNPRDIKRYINTFTLATKVMPLLNQNAVLAMQTVQFRPDWELVRHKLLAYRGFFIDALRRQLDGERNALESLDPDLSAVPVQFFGYVGPGGPGAPMLSVPSIDEYIYAGEATRSEFGVGVSDLVRDVTKLRGLLRAAAAVQDANAAEIQAARHQLSVLRGRSRELSSLPATFSGLVLRQLDDLDSKVNELPVQRRDEWLVAGDAVIRRVVSDLLQFSRSG